VVLEVFRYSSQAPRRSPESGPAGVGDLYKVAVLSEPPMPLGDGNERSQKTRLGKALGRMRDRIFHVGPSALRITSAGIRHQIIGHDQVAAFLRRVSWIAR
jgi:hypothetical protein